jgi:hypothetical protein
MFRRNIWLVEKNKFKRSRSIGTPGEMRQFDLHPKWLY